MQSVKTGGRQRPSLRSENSFLGFSKRRWFALALVLALAVVLFDRAPPQGEIKAQDVAAGADDGKAPKDDGAEAGDEQATADDLSDEHIEKLLPDQKAYFDSPPSVIDLSETFLNAEVADGAPVKSIEVIHNSKSKYVGATVEGQQLTLNWKKIGKTEITLRVTFANGKSLRNRFKAEVWRADVWKLLFAVVGGLGIFLLGMKNMSEGLQAIAGNGLRRMISMVTDNRLMATAVGTTVTMLVQSSSITTVMVVGFVNSGFMTLSQAVGVIMGANIGTTITGWVLVLQIGKYGLPIVGAAAFVYLFSKRDRVRFLAMSVMGLGMVFLGLELMKNGFSIVKDLPDFEAWFKTFDAKTYLGVLKCAAVGCVLTFIVQSSSATLGITIGLAQIGVIQFETAAALVMGENVGTTITAWLASFGATTNAKRAAYFHIIFNLVGVFWITAIFRWYLPLLEIVVAQIGWLFNFEPDVTFKIASAHTGFNVVNTLIFLPLAPALARLLVRFVPDKPHKETPHLTSLDVRMLETPVIAIEQSRVEIMRMADGCRKMMDWSRQINFSEAPDDKAVRDLFHREEVLDVMQDEIVEFMTHLLAGSAPHDIVDEARRQLRMADEYESVSDYITTIVKSHLKLHNSGLQLPQAARDDLAALHDSVSEYIALVAKGYEQRRGDVITEAKSQGSAITRRIKELRDQFLVRMSEETFDPQVSVAYNAQLNSYRRVRDHVLNIAEAIAGEK
ncbi:MAG: Na/Pi cotransporter family protein [Planctomycetes bacterium]|nr:Na/Pi cotransporter family protein [Planctomycetota bacterium]